MEAPFRAGSACIGALFLVVAACGESLDVDRCLDSGGSFDYVTRKCDLSRNHPGPPGRLASRPKHLLGTFSAVSESEWTLDLTLRADGTAVVDRSWWGGADDYSKTEQDRITGTWHAVADIIAVRYGESEDRLCYSPQLSRSELGESGALPGVKACGTPSDGSAIGSHSLWLGKPAVE